MGLIALALIGVAGLIGAAFSKILAEEFKAWAPSIARQLVRAAVLRLPADDRERYDEEWLAHVNETPGDIGKILAAAGTNVAAWKMAGADEKYPRITRLRLARKRLLDIGVSASALFILLPPLIIVGLAIKLDSPGPMFVRLPRIGKGGKVFAAFKFRSFTFGATELRVTRVGRFLRRTNLDELPQLVNILLGNMSLVGPRYHPPSMIAAGEAYDKLMIEYHDRHKVRPGLTGLAQMRGLRGSISTKDAARRRLSADLEYVRKFSFWLDIKIIYGTVIIELGGGNPKLGQQILLVTLAFILSAYGFLVALAL